MKYVKFLVLNIIVFGVLFTLISLLFPSVIQTSKTINIGGGENKILSSLFDATSWKKWNMFSQTDSLTNATVITDSSIVVTKWEYNRGRKLQCEIAVYKSTTDSIPVSFTITEKLKWYPWEKFSSLLLEMLKSLPKLLFINS